MLSQLPVGTYIPRESLVHRLRARTKLLLLLWLAVSVFLANHKMFHFGVFILAFGLLAVAIILARMPLNYIWRRMRLLLILLAIGIPFSLAWTPGDTWRTFGPLRFSIPLPWGEVPLSLGPVVVTYDGLWFTFTFAAIFLVMYLGTMTLTLTSTPVALGEAVVVLLRPFRRLGIPADDFGLMTLVSLRFIPVLIQETETLIKAQVSRGADFTTGPIPARIRGISTLLVPMVQGALRRAEGLSAALESRGYGTGHEATLLYEERLRPLDWLLLLVIPALTVLAFLFL